MGNILTEIGQSCLLASKEYYRHVFSVMFSDDLDFLTRFMVVAI